MKRFLVIILLVLNINVADASSFEESSEDFFTSGKAICLKMMTKYNEEERKIYCECADKITRSNISDVQLHKLFSGEIQFSQLMAPVAEKHESCNQGLHPIKRYD